MIDSIGRKLAIDTIKGTDVCVCYPENESVEIENVINLAIKATKGSVIVNIEQLPPAQPEIITCEGCYYSVEEDNDKYYCDHPHGLIGFVKPYDYCSKSERKIIA